MLSTTPQLYLCTCRLMGCRLSVNEHVYVIRWVQRAGRARGNLSECLGQAERPPSRALQECGVECPLLVENCLPRLFWRAE